MNQEKSVHDDEKRKESKDDRNKTSAATEVGATSKQKQIAEIFKLNIDCFEEAFDYLVMNDMMSMGQTCKLLNEIAGYCFQQHYLAISKYCGRNGIYRYKYGDDFHIDGFSRYINKIEIDTEAGFQFFRLNRLKFLQLKQMSLKKLIINEIKMESIKDKLKSVESLRLLNCRIKGDSYEFVLKFCPNLKHLSLESENSHRLIADAGTKWLLQKYPTLEVLDLKPIYPVPDEMKAFFELNSNIRKFRTFARFLSLIQQLMIDANVKLDDLEVYVERKERFSSICNMLKELYRHGVYKRLHLYIGNTTQEKIDKIVSLNSLVKLQVDESIILPELRELVELYIYESVEILNLGEIALKIPNLKRVDIHNATYEDILMFIGRSKQLKKFRIGHFENGKFIDLIKLNVERQKLDGAEKVTLFVGEELYLATKWALNVTDLNKIVLKHKESYEWDHLVTFVF